MKINVLIGGGISMFDRISTFITDNEDIFEYLNLYVYDGLNNCKWNGGRVNRNIFYTDEQLKFYEERNIGFKLVFTNNIINISDKTGNDLLERFHNKNNGVILVCDSLRSHIRENFKEYKLTYSITGTDNINVPMRDSDIQHYKKLEELYDLIVPRAEHNLDYKMQLLDKNKYELYITEGCCTKCPVWSKHFNSMAEANRIYDTFTQQMATELESCWLDKSSKEFDFDKHILDHRQVFKLHRNGFSNFKLSGRDADQRYNSGTLDDYLSLIKNIYLEMKGFYG